MVHFYHIWIEHSCWAMAPYCPQRKQNQQGNNDEPG